LPAIVAAEAKVCTGCGIMKPLTEFGRHRGTRDGHNCRCKGCCRAGCAAWRAANPEKVRASNAAQYKGSS
jgi:hypothetical protein